MLNDLIGKTCSIKDALNDFNGFGVITLVIKEIYEECATFRICMNCHMTLF